MAENNTFNKETKKKKIIFLTGGVCSSVGKGIAISSVATLLKSLGYKVGVKKCDPYLNIDPGTLSPYQHGEVFVTADGVETDLDMGNYERFTGQACKQTDYITSGRVYWEILTKERQGAYEGKTVMVIPHVVDQISKMMMQDTDDLDFLLCEIGGTVGDLEATPYYEAIRQLSGKQESMLIHVAYLLFVYSANEVKTKPVQHSVRELLSLGLQPDLIICRSEKKPEDDGWKAKISSFANLDDERVILGEDVKNSYEMLCMYSDAGLLTQVCKFFEIPYDEKCTAIVKQYKEYAKIAKEAQKVITIGIVGKYISLEDSYKSLTEALFYSCTLSKARLQIKWICAESLFDNDAYAWETLKAVDGIIVPGGFGERGAEGMIKAIQYARENDVPFLGICLGMQMAAVETARNLCAVENACSAEFNENGVKVIDLIDNVLQVEEKYKLTAKITGAMRLGAYETTIEENSILKKIYGAEKVTERFRHRYEVNKKYLLELEKAGLTADASTDLGGGSANRFIDALARADKKFFVSVQYHPEFLSAPLTGHPLFNAFINACAQD